MGFWADIKYALNSTLGTSEFQSLDKIIKGQKTFVANDNILAVLSNGETVWGYSSPIATFTSNTNGSVRLMANIKTSNTNPGAIGVLDGGVEIARLTDKVTSFTPISVDFQVKKDVTYTIRGVGPNGFTTTYIRLGASVVDGSLFEYELA